MNAHVWRSESDFHDALVEALGAPDWHGRNLDAWEESIRDDNINSVRAPYIVIVEGAGSLEPRLRSYVERFVALFEAVRANSNIEVYAVLTPLN